MDYTHTIDGYFDINGIASAPSEVAPPPFAAVANSAATKAAHAEFYADEKDILEAVAKLADEARDLLDLCKKPQLGNVVEWGEQRAWHRQLTAVSMGARSRMRESAVLIKPKPKGESYGGIDY